MLKKVVSTSRKLANLKSDSARLLYTWLLPHLDIEGRFSADPKIVKGYVVPRLKMSLRKINEYLEEMVKNDLIIIYEMDGDKYLQLRKFKDFQTLRATRESKSIIPPPLSKSRITPGVSTENSSTSKVKGSKVKGSKVVKEKNDTLRKKIIDYFNKITSQKRSYTSDETNKFIDGRINEGRDFKDFKHVIDTKTSQWLNDLKMRKFLRPSTLFRPGHFEDYVNEPYEDPKKTPKKEETQTMDERHEKAMEERK